MKKISLLLLSIFVFSCVQEETLQEESILNNKTINTVSSRGGAPTDIFNQQEKLNAKLKIYAYAIGSIFKNDFEQANYEIQSYIEITGSDEIPLSFFLDTSWFGTKIREQLNLMQSLDFGYNDPIGRMHPTVTLRHEDLPVFRDAATQEIAYINHRNFNESTGIELFIARDLLENNAVNITSHPLNNIESSLGYVFVNPTNSNATFDASFLTHNSNNVLVVRPYRDVTHPYSYIDVVDFTTYYSN